MKKNNKGFFLAETIVVIALVTTVMAFVYPNVTKLYENYKNRANYYDQTEDIFALINIKETMYTDIVRYIDNDSLNYCCPTTTNCQSGCNTDDYVTSKNLLDAFISNENNLKDEQNKFILLYDSSNTQDEVKTEIEKIIHDNDIHYFTCLNDWYNSDYHLKLNFADAKRNNYTCDLAINKYNNLFKTLEIEKLYVDNYMLTASDYSDNYSFLRYANRIKKTSYLPDWYRLIAIFKHKDDNGNDYYTYASIAITNKKGE